MDYLNEENTVGYVIVIVVVIIVVLWLINNNNSEKFSNEQNNSEMVNKSTEQQSMVMHQTQENVSVQNNNLNNLTADDRTIASMNQVNASSCDNNLACSLSNNLSNADKAMIADYKNKYYKMYAHQISCANGSGNLTGCAKKCYKNGMSPKTCTTPECEQSMSELNNMGDFVSLNQLILDKNNTRSCSTCTQGPMMSRAVGVQNILNQVTDLDNVSASFMNSQLLTQPTVNPMREAFNNLSEELKEKDAELKKKKKVTFANVNNFANFNNYISQNGVLETSVDKLAEIRSDNTNSATCGLKQYGQTISQVYDNLMSNPYMEYKKSCDVEKITGISDNVVNDFQGNGNFGGNYSGNYASV